MAERVQIIIEAQDKATPVLRGLNEQFGQLGGLLEKAASAAIGGLLFTGLEKMISAAAEAEAVNTRLEAALTATGRASEISADQIDQTATSLEHISAFDDESIKSAYTALMQFDNIPTDKLEDIAKAAMDVTAAMGGDLAGNAENIGRILETGIVPRTWGFNAALKDQVKQMVAAGDSGGALALVLDELNSRYGGQAAAQLTTYSGKLQKIKNDWSDLLEVMGQATLPSGKGVLDWLDEVILKFQATNRAAQILAEEGLTTYFLSYGTITGKLKTATEEQIQAAEEQARQEVMTGKAFDSATSATWEHAGAMDGDRLAAMNNSSAQEVLNGALKVQEQQAKEITQHYTDMLGAMKDMQSETDRWTKAQEDKDKADQQADHDLRAGLITMAEYQQRISDNNAALDESREKHKEWAAQVVFSLLQAKAAADGKITDGEMKVLEQAGVSLGVFGADTVAAIDTANAAFDNLGSGNIENTQQALDDVRKALIDLTGTDWVIPLRLDASGVVLPNIGGGYYGGGGSSTTWAGYLSQNYAVNGQAEGGPVYAGTPYLVGERGPELFMPQQSGEIVPNGKLGGNITINVTGVVDRQMVDYLAQEITRIQTG